MNKINVKNNQTMIPKNIFFVKGAGTHKDRLASFEIALRNAGIEKYNLVYVSSIFPPGCKEIAPKQGLKELSPGQIVYCVMAKSDTNEPNRLISAAIGVALPKEKDMYERVEEVLKSVVDKLSSKHIHMSHGLKGNAKLRPLEDGRYQFSMSIDPPAS